MSDENKSREELLAELQELRAELASARSASTDPMAEEEEHSGSFGDGGGISRRKVLGTAWVAPVVVTVGASAQTGSPPSGTTTTLMPTLSPTSRPTISPTVAPTGGPTTQPTQSPTFMPTLAPTSEPTACRPPIQQYNTPKRPTLPTPPVRTTTTLMPTLSPTSRPTISPTNGPTNSPTTSRPTVSPTNTPTSRQSPTFMPTLAPTTSEPTVVPTPGPTLD